jgi:hypothetical protein
MHERGGEISCSILRGSAPTHQCAGLIDLLGSLIELPPGTERFFLSLGFMMQAFILSEWNYGSMLAGNLYYLVFLLSAGAVFFILAEIVWPNSFFVSCGR